jgi:uncharacterized membrane protein
MEIGIIGKRVIYVIVGYVVIILLTIYILYPLGNNK